MMQTGYSTTYMQPDDRRVAGRMVTRWFDELQLHVASTRSMLCNFCNKGSDCILNGNDLGY